MITVDDIGQRLPTFFLLYPKIKFYLCLVGPTPSEKLTIDLNFFSDLINWLYPPNYRPTNFSKCTILQLLLSHINKNILIKNIVLFYFESFRIT